MQNECHPAKEKCPSAKRSQILQRHSTSETGKTQSCKCEKKHRNHVNATHMIITTNADCNDENETAQRSKKM